VFVETFHFRYARLEEKDVAGDAEVRGARFLRGHDRASARFSMRLYDRSAGLKQRIVFHRGREPASVSPRCLPLAPSGEGRAGHPLARSLKFAL